MLHPFYAAYYSEKNRAQLDQLAVADLDTAEHLWGGPDYTRAFRNLLVGPADRRGETWQAWITTGDIEQAEEPLFYVLHHPQRFGSHKIDRWSLYAALDVNEPSLFLHEDVSPEGVERARQGAEACESDLAPIFVGCEESLAKKLRSLLQSGARGKEPLLRYREGEHSEQSLWPVRDPSLAQKLQALFNGAPLFLLDGHHRLAAARENHRLGMGDGRVLACICSMDAKDTLILPIHRAVRYERWVLENQMEEDLRQLGCLTEPLAGLKVSDIPAYLRRHPLDTPFCVALHADAATPILVHLPRAPSLPGPLAELSVAALDHELLGKLEHAASLPMPSPEIALEQLAVGQAQAIFFLPPAAPREVRAIALARLRMPRKSTRFVPKPSLGLICRPWQISG